MIRTLADFAPAGVEAGVGLALQDEQGRYLFFLAGTRHNCPAGELFYAGIGGHREPGESWLTCARREAREEIDAEIEILPAAVTWHIPHGGPAHTLVVADRPRPLALYEMVYRPGVPGEGALYRIVVYRAQLCSPVGAMPEDEVRGVIALTRDQVVQVPVRRPALAELLETGATLVAGAVVDLETRLYPLGTAAALAEVLKHQTC